MGVSDAERDICLRVLQQVADDPSLIAHDERFKTLVRKIHRHGKKHSRDTTRAGRQQADDRAVAACALVQRATQASDHLPGETPPRTVHSPRSCYICKQPYTRLDVFYHLLCPACSALNMAKRHQRADLRGRVALLTGGRVKIGFQVALRLLRDGARVILTTRFPQDAAERFLREPDAALWRERLRIHALDLRNLATVEQFIAELLYTEPWLDILINNAAQTIKRPLAFYQHLLTPAADASSALVLARDARPALLEAHPAYPADNITLSAYFPAGAFDADGQQVDARPANSWIAEAGDVSTLELLEVQLVNAIAPFLLTSRLKPLLLRSPHPRRVVVQVSAMEGQFARASKTTRHPHTNMAKAALNMLTRTSAAEYARDGILMNSVDTGWITDENPVGRQPHTRDATGFVPPLDVIDGMARIYDPVVQALTRDDAPFGQFLKDYRPYNW